MMDAGDDAEPVGIPHPEVLAMPADRQADLAVARLVGRTLSIAAAKLGIPTVDVGFDDLCDRVLDGMLERWRATGQIDTDQYRAIFRTRELLAPRVEGTPLAE
jgi:hypothetical protein